MTDRGLPTADSAPACPFVAYADDRDARSTSPDQRHRCFAETPPAPRAFAHQEAYCLSSAFPVCPVFQEWARREAAHADGGGGQAPGVSPAATAAGAAAGGAAGAAAGGAAGAAAGTSASAGSAAYIPPTSDSISSVDAGGSGAVPTAGQGPAGAPASGGASGTPAGAPQTAEPPRDWAAPPPWATAPSQGSPRPADHPTTPDFLADRSDPGQGLAGSAGDVLAGGAPRQASTTPGAAAWSASAGAALSAAPDEELAGLVGGTRSAQGGPPAEPQPVPPPPRPPAPPPSRPPQVSSPRPRPVQPATTWRGGRRYEAYPPLGRRGWRGVPRVVIFAGALALAALVLFFLPALLGVGGGGSASPSPNASASGAVSTAAPSPTTPPAPTQQVYVVKQGDTMSKVAKQFGVTVDELCNANKSTIKDCNKLAIGDQLVIPSAPPQQFTDTPEPSAS